jgi:hypothetical protein
MIKVTKPKTDEATSTDLKVIERLMQLGWGRGDTLLYQQEYALSQEYDGKDGME